VGDHTASITAVAAICAALIHLGKTGQGRLIDVSLLRTGLYTLSTDLAIQLFFGRIASTRSRQEAYHPLSNFFRTQDEAWICLVPRTGEGDLPRIARALDAPEILTDAAFAGSRARRDNAAHVIATLDQHFRKFTLAELAPRLDTEELVWAPAQTLAEAAADPQVQAAGAIAEMPSKQPGASMPTPAGPARFVGLDDGPKGPGPGLGQHTRVVLTQAGLTDADIDGLFASGAVA
jgi:crotonobetainyl-CoA:carnitine CoA-transferase CaiB-like acyl-CoA transferase